MALKIVNLSTPEGRAEHDTFLKKHLNRLFVLSVADCYGGDEAVKALATEEEYHAWHESRRRAEQWKA